MTMDVRIQVQGLGVLVTLETVDVTPGQCQGGWLSLENVDVSLHTGCGEDCHPGDCGHVTPCTGSGSMVTVETGNLTPGVVSVREGYTGDCGYVIPGAQTIVVGSH